VEIFVLFSRAESTGKMLQQHTAAMNKAGALVNVRSAQPTPIEIAGRTLTSLYFYKNMNSFLP